MAAADAPYHVDGLLARTLKWTRLFADEPSDADRKYDNTQLALMLSGNVDHLLTELYGLTDDPPLSVFDVTVVAGVQHYKLPPNVQEIRRIACIDTATGLPKWTIEPQSPRSPWGENILFDGLQDFQLRPIPETGGDILTFEYIPGGHVAFHQNAAPLYTGDNDTGDLRITLTTFRANYSTGTGWFLGTMDHRTNAFVGHRLRILGTVNDVVAAGLTGGATPPWFPPQERRIQAYDLCKDMLVTVAPSFDAVLLPSGDWSAWAGVDKVTLPPYGPRTYFIYEIVPDLDPAILWCAALQTAIDVLSIGNNPKKVALLETLLAKRKRGLHQRWINHQTIKSMQFDETDADIEDFEDLA